MSNNSEKKLSSIIQWFVNNSIVTWFFSKEFGLIFVQNVVFAIFVGIILGVFQANIQEQQSQKIKEENLSRVDISIITNQREEIIKKMIEYSYSLQKKAEEVRKNTGQLSTNSKNDSYLTKLPDSKDDLDLTKLTGDLQAGNLILINILKSFGEKKLSEDLVKFKNKKWQIFNQNKYLTREELDLQIKKIDDLGKKLVKKMYAINSFIESNESRSAYFDHQFCFSQIKKSDICKNFKDFNVSFAEYITEINTVLKMLIN